jgi:hypothetical protein
MTFKLTRTGFFKGRFISVPCILFRCCVVICFLFFGIFDSNTFSVEYQAGAGGRERCWILPLPLYVLRADPICNIYLLLKIVVIAFDGSPLYKQHVKRCVFHWIFWESLIPIHLVPQERT